MEIHPCLTVINRRGTQIKEIRIRKKGSGPAMRLIKQLSLYKIPKLELETKAESGKTSSGSRYEMKLRSLRAFFIRLSHHDKESRFLNYMDPYSLHLHLLRLDEREPREDSLVDDSRSHSAFWDGEVSLSFLYSPYVIIYFLPVEKGQTPRLVE
ncbi:inositol requiring 1-1 [Striga asiatica]|uniref:Inositol requiring 1-1 n=1 Tax=Striga asiatica TaxID=4170 RepID=A0A5A7QLE3_STRAF|nr:inositol requiring 1-1 [Striga asiatica]